MTGLKARGFSICLAAIFTAIVVLMWSAQVNAAGAAGKITRVDGKVSITRGGKPIPAETGVAILEGDSIRTEVKAKVKMLMADGTILDIGPSSKFNITEYYYNPTTRANYSLVYGRGRAKVPRSRKRPNVRFTTPTAVAGVRGTDIIFEYDEATGLTRIITVTGTVMVVNPSAPGQETILTAGMSTTVGAGLIPTPPVQMPELEIQNLIRGVQPSTRSPRRVITIVVPGGNTQDVNQVVPPGIAAGGGGLTTRGGGLIVNPQDLIDQEPPPFTPVIINIWLN